MVGIGDVAGDRNHPVEPGNRALERGRRSRASTTMRQPRPERARVSASPRPREPPVTIACTDQASTGTPWRATIRS